VDTPAYREVAKSDAVEKLPLVRALKEYPRQIAYVLAFSAVTGVVFYIVSGYVGAFLTVNGGMPQTRPRCGSLPRARRTKARYVLCFPCRTLRDLRHTAAQRMPADPAFTLVDIRRSCAPRA
jgi:hypothetical protein